MTAGQVGIRRSLIAVALIPLIAMGLLGSTGLPERLSQPPRSPAEVQRELAARPAVKIHVREPGWYRVERSGLIRAGLDPGAPGQRLQLFTDGAEVPIQIINSFPDEWTAIEFFAVGPDQPTADSRVYWLVADEVEGLRIRQAEGEASLPSPAGFWSTSSHHERSIYFPALRNGDEENFFGMVIGPGPEHLLLDLPGLQTDAPGPAQLVVRLQGASISEHRVRVHLNDAPIGQLAFSTHEQGVGDWEVPHPLLRAAGNELTLVPEGEIDLSLVDRIDVTYWRWHVAQHEGLQLTAMAGEEVRVGGFARPPRYALDVTNPRAVQRISLVLEQENEGFAATFVVPGTEVRSLWIFGEEQVTHPASVRPNVPSTWHQARDGADLVIISPRAFWPALEPLREQRARQDISSVLVDVEDIFDELSHGHPDPYAIRAFLADARARWARPPRFALLVGDASLDPRGYLGLGSQDLVPTKLTDTAYLETASDDWLVDFDQDGLPELPIGRLPARTEEDVAVMVAKTLQFERGPRAGSAVLVADEDPEFDFRGATERLAALVPADRRVEMLSREEPSVTRARLWESLQAGPWLVNYLGHGQVDYWRGSVLTAEDVRASTAGNIPSMFVMMTCLNGYFIDPVLESLAEALLRVPTGGAVAVWSSSGMTAPHDQIPANLELFRILFGERSQSLKPTLGEATLQAKQAAHDPDVRRTWILFGDPSLPL